MVSRKGDLQRSVQPKNRLSGGYDPGTMKYSTKIGPVKPVGLRMAEYSQQKLDQMKQRAAPKPKPKPPQVIRTTVSERVTPASAKAAAPARMAINRATGDTTGFTSGKTTGKTVTKAGVATKTGGTAYQQMQRNAMQKSGVAGPRKDSSGRNVSSMTGNRTSSVNTSRSTNSRFPGK